MSLLALPPELRILIYKCISPVNGPVCEYKGLFLACKKIYSETSVEIVKNVQQSLDELVEKWHSTTYCSLDLRFSRPTTLGHLSRLELRLPYLTSTSAELSPKQRQAFGLFPIFSLHSTAIVIRQSPIAQSPSPFDSVPDYIWDITRHNSKLPGCQVIIVECIENIPRAGAFQRGGWGLNIRQLPFFLGWHVDVIDGASGSDRKFIILSRIGRLFPALPSTGPPNKPAKRMFGHRRNERSIPEQDFWVLRHLTRLHFAPIAQ